MSKLCKICGMEHKEGDDLSGFSAHVAKSSRQITLQIEDDEDTGGAIMKILKDVCVVMCAVSATGLMVFGLFSLIKLIVFGQISW